MSLEPRQKSVIDRCILGDMDYMKFAGIFISVIGRGPNYGDLHKEGFHCNRFLWLAPF